MAVSVTFREAMSSAARAYLFRVLSDTGGNMAKAAQRAGVHRQSMYNLLKKHGLKVQHRKYERPTSP